MERRDTCRTTLALNLHRKNKSDIARKIMCSQWHRREDRSKWRCGEKDKRTQVPERWEQSPWGRGWEPRKEKHHQSSEMWPSDSREDPRTQEKGNRPTKAKPKPRNPKDEVTQQQPYASTDRREERREERKKHRRRQRGQFRWYNERQERPVVNARIFQISSIWNISTNFNECRCRPCFMPGQADLNVIFPK